MIELKDIDKTYSDGPQEVHALRGVNLRIEAGEAVSIMGPSGSGKSTLLHILGCLDHATSGTYLFDGKDVGSFNDQELTRTRNRRIGFVFQSFNLLPRETALENVILPLVYAGVKDAKERGRSALESVGLANRFHHRPGQLSGGEQQRVAIARALVKEPQIILADEPTGNLDSQVGRSILELFRNVHEKGITLVMITHSETVGAFGQRRFLLQDGELREESQSPQPVAS